MLKRQDGRARSEIIPEEELALLEEELKSLDVNEREALIRLVEEHMAADGAEVVKEFAALDESMYDRHCVDIDTFLRDEYFLGHIGKTLYPCWHRDLRELFKGDYHEAIISGSIGCGKNTFASVALCYMIYQMSCLRDPQAVFGLEKGSEIAFCCISVNEKLARRAVFGGIKTKIMSSRYFMDEFPYRPTLSELRFPNNIWVAASSSSMSSALSLNTFGGILDEVNFFQSTPPRVSKIRYGAKRRERHSHAETLYQMILRRMKSRYSRSGKLPGVLMMISSKSHTDAFTERRIAASATDPSILVREYALWEAKPGHLFSEETFSVFVGNERLQSRLISRDEERVRLQGCIDNDPDYDGCRIVQVPIDFRRDFEEDLDSALQDLAGVATVSISPFIQRRETLYDAIDETRGHPMATLEWNPQTLAKVDWRQLTRMYSSKDSQGNVSQFEGPIVNPEAPRHLHLDTSLNHDATGLAIGHVAGTVQVERRDDDGVVFVEDAPEIYIDFLLRIVPPPGDDIILADIRTLIYSFMDHGFQFALATTDQYQSAEMRQYLELQRGVETKLQSMDRTLDPYMELRAAFYEGRMNMYAYEPFLREMQRVVHDKVRQKVDHLEGESKDVSDAVAGVAFTLSRDQALMPIPLKMGISTWEDVSMPDEWLRKDYALEKGKEEGPVKRGPGQHHWLMPLSG